MEAREVFANAPLRLVALELNFAMSPRPQSLEVWQALERAVGAELPVVEVLVEDAANFVPTRSYEPLLRRLTQERRRAVTLHPGALQIEIADYKQFEELQVLLDRVLEAVAPDGESLECSRVGLRYINEVASALVHGPEDNWQEPTSWLPYINEQLVHTIDSGPEGLCAYASRGGVAFHAKAEGRNEIAVLEYGARPFSMVDADDVLDLGKTTGPHFLLDIDGFLRSTDAGPAASNAKEISAAVEAVHQTVEEVFDWSITERLKEQVLRERPNAELSRTQGGGVHADDA